MTTKSRAATPRSRSLSKSKLPSDSLPLDAIRLDGGTQPRAKIDDFVVEDYKDSMKAGANFPPVIVFYDGEHYWLADGYHRYHGAVGAGLNSIRSEIRQGTRREAVLFSVGANTVHGLRRTNEDKRRAVTTLLADTEWGRWSNREIARRCGVTDPFVMRVRAELPVNGSPNGDSDERKFMRNGKTYQMNTVAINGNRNGNGNGNGHHPTLDPQVLSLVRDTTLADNRREVERIAALPPEIQIEVARKAAEGAPSVKKAVEMVVRARQQPAAAVPPKSRSKRGAVPGWQAASTQALLINANSGASIALASNSVDCIVTSTPYWGMRDYGSETVWGGDPACRHKWGKSLPPHHPGQVEQRNQGRKSVVAGQLAGGGQFCQKCGAWRGVFGLEPTPELFDRHMMMVMREAYRVLKPTGVMFLNLGDSFASAKSRYSSRSQTLSGNQSRQEPVKGKKPDVYFHPALKDKDLVGIPWRVAFALQGFTVIPGSELDRAADLLALARKNKDWELVACVEQMLRDWAALSSWLEPYWLRAEIIWVKDNVRPESVLDRPTRDFEHIFMLAKSADYFYDAQAVKEPYQQPIDRWGGDVKKNSEPKREGDPYITLMRERSMRPDPTGRNRRSVWGMRDDPVFKLKHDLSDEARATLITQLEDGQWPQELLKCIEWAEPMPGSIFKVSTRPYPEAHFASYPPELIEPCILAGTSAAGCCPKCGRPYERIVQREAPVVGVDIPAAARKKNSAASGTVTSAMGVSNSAHWIKFKETNPDRTLGWQPTCECYGRLKQVRGLSEGNDDLYADRPVRLYIPNGPQPMPKPAVVLDMFCGTGATGVPALKNGRMFIGSDLSFAYLSQLARKRLGEAFPVDD